MIRALFRLDCSRCLTVQLLSWVFLALTTGLIGCGGSDRPIMGKVYDVKGSVLLPDGKPLTRARVEFEPAKDSIYPASGALGPDGSFTLETTNAGAGAVQGEYRVKIVPDETMVGFVTRGNTITRDLSKLPFSSRYLDADASGLTATVKPEANLLRRFKLSNTRSNDKPRRQAEI